VEVIFDLRQEPKDWADTINNELQNTFPDYFKENSKVGSEEWWENSNFDISNGRITHVGPLMDDGELIDVVVIEPLDEEFNGSSDSRSSGQPDYMVYRSDFWLNENVSPDKTIETESILIMPSGEMDETTIYIETKVKVW
jgi:hypothetical protein